MINKLKKIFFDTTVLLITLSSITFGEVPIYELFGTKIFFNSEKNIISAEGEALATDKSGKKIMSDKIIYNKDKLTISTFSNSIYNDESGNTIKADQFIYDLNKKIIKATKNVEYLDKNGNKFNFSELEYFENSEKGFGKNFNGTLIDKSRFEGKTVEFDSKLGKLIIGDKKKSNIFNKILNFFNDKTNYYTPCEAKKNETSIKENCPDWSINTKKTIHDKKNQEVRHYGAIIKIKDVPVFYTPYFSHPDPSVKRKSGFLPPSLKNFSDLGRTIKIPYFQVIDDSRDFTFTPIYYFNENPLFLAEYRQQNTNSKFYLDTSYTSGYKQLNKVDDGGNAIARTDGSRNHLFFNFLGNFDNLIYDKNELEINVQRISQKNYLNINQINTENVKQYITNLNNNIILNSYEGNKKLTIQSNIFENINNENQNTKYQYNIPSITFDNFINRNNQNLNFTNTFIAQNLGGDSNKITQTNKIETVSNGFSYFFENITNTFKTSINNINYNNDNISNEKNNFNSDLHITGAIESSLPLIKFGTGTTETLTPRVLTKYTTGSMTNSSNENKLISRSDIFSMNRMSNNTNPETGASLGYGVEYEKKIKNSDNSIKTKSTFFVGQVLRPEKLSEMPRNSTLSNTRSAYVGTMTVNHKMDSGNKNLISNENQLNLSYDYIINNDINKILKNAINANINIDKNFLAINYFKTNEIGDDHYIDLKYQKKIDNDFSFVLGGRKNLKTNFTENNFLETNYETDCIKISFNMSKTFYYNEELKPSSSLNLSVILKPFGSPISPDLSSFLN